MTEPLDPSWRNKLWVTEEGLSGTAESVVQAELASSFDLLIVWLAVGNSHLKNELNDENASNLCALASYYGLV
ncbi:hypothetical protein ACA910_016460 [Epithemia clementina (nom. ined.)]